jgi:hypothetical protein
LGLAVIERWTHAFLANYEKSNPDSTLHEAMFSPSEKKILGSVVGLKDDTSHRKFNDTKLSYFFGTKGGRSKDGVTERISPINTVMDISSESLLKLPSTDISLSWLFPRDSSASPIEESLQQEQTISSLEKEHEHGKHFTDDDDDDDDSLLKLSENEFYYIITGFIFILLLATKLEKRIIFHR